MNKLSKIKREILKDQTKRLIFDDQIGVIKDISNYLNEVKRYEKKESNILPSAAFLRRVAF
jgi:hypothetical protein